MLKSKQITKLIDAAIGINGLTASGNSTTVTSQITSALSSAGDGGVSVPLQVATSTTIGVVISSSLILQILDATTKQVLVDGSGNEIYGKLTQSGGVYTLSYYSLVSGTETAYSFSSTSIYFEFAYRFDFYRLPVSFALNKNVYDDYLSPTAAKVYTEVLTVTGTNTLSNLTKTPSTTSNVLLFVNNAVYSAIASDFSVSSKTITWSAAAAGFSLDTGDSVVAHYTTNE
ncbi:hypothetical protein [Nostoc sp. FACHB-110]|uniref:hypothetical protein n=1 Tax=Nostoc sp. FACHB-110 TaxID=2692834 RepID=UPI001683D4B0|nr:hypothetical protein [Nostoc sp. FACHB-110]MBD2437365.1 hypothetical protein [Nostoc sp. FACHB-110]